MDKKVILNLSTVVNGGGAGNYVLQNHLELLKLEYDSYLIVKETPRSDNTNVLQYQDKKFSSILQKLKRSFYRLVFSNSHFDDKYLFLNKFEQFGCYSASSILKLLPNKPDVIFVYWVSGFVNAKILHDLAQLTNAKIYILMIDNAPLTGGCHFPWECKGFQNNCSSCPAISNTFLKILAKQNLAFKHKYKLSNVTLVAATQTDYNRAANSMLYHSTPIIKLVEIVNEFRFKPAFSKQVAKNYFNLDENKKVVFFGSSFLDERRKGMSELLQAINLMDSENVILLIAGTADIGLISVSNKRVGYLSESDLILAYQAADLFVCPSLEDSGPLMINQSIMCGTPVVAFDMGSAKDLVLTGKTGYRALYANVTDLAKGIDFVLALNEQDSKIMANECRNLALQLYSTSAFKASILKMI